MPQRTLTEQEYNAVRDRVLQSAPDNLDEAGFARWIGPSMSEAIQMAESDPEPSSAPQAPSLAERVATGGLGPRLPGSAVSSDFQQPSELNKSLSTMANPQTPGEMLSLLMPTGIGAWASKVVSNMKANNLTASEAVRGLASAAGSAAGDVSDVVSGTLSGVKGYLAKRAPLTSDIVRAVQDNKSARAVASVERSTNVTQAARAAESALRARAAEAGVRLTKAETKTLQDAIREALEGVRSADTANAPARVAGTVKAPVGVAERGAVSASQTTPQGMTASQPDKWGMTDIRPASEVDLVLQRANQGGTQREVQALYDRIKAKLAAKEPLTQMEAAFIQQGKR